MKRIFYIMMILVSVLALFPSHGRAATQDAPFITDLIAGQNTDVGDIKVWDDGTYLYVQYTTVDPWCLEETHLAIGSDLSDIPQKNGNPIPGQFPYKNTHKCATSFTYTIPLIQNSCTLYIAAHAATNSGETAWGSGSDFDGKNWATYFTYTPESCLNTPPPITIIASTPTYTPTSTPTSSVTATSTNTPTATATGSVTATSTPTSTPTGTVTPPTPTFTDTATSTSTSTPTGTITPPTPTFTDTATPTSTPTGTITPQVCQPTIVTADLSKFVAGASIEGMGKVVPNLNIDAQGTAVRIATGLTPNLYFAPNVGGVANGELMVGGGFSDYITKTAGQAHKYTFTFAAGTSVSNFSLHMLDFGDLNPTLSTSHHVSMTAYNAANTEVAKQELSYTSSAEQNPHSSDLYGDLNLSGDAAGALPNQPGNWTWNVSGSGIVKVVLEFGVGFDPNIGFDGLTFTVECP